MNTLKNIALGLSDSQTLSNNEMVTVIGGCYRRKRTYRFCCVKPKTYNMCNNNPTNTDSGNTGSTDNNTDNNTEVLVE